MVETQEQSEKLERQTIKELKPVFNMCTYDGVAKYKTTRPVTNFKHYAKLVYDNFDTDEEKIATERIKEIDLVLRMVEVGFNGKKVYYKIDKALELSQKMIDNPKIAGNIIEF